MNKIRPLVISGPSGAGKSTLLNKLFCKYEGCFAFSVSHTTRSPRHGEVDGKDYYFTTREKFEELKSQNGFLEYAEFAGNLYGTSKASVNSILNSGRICVLDVDLAGVKSIYNCSPSLDARFIFVQPPSIAALERRLRDRKTETEDKIQARLSRAQTDIDFAESPEGNKIYNLLIVNDILEVALATLEGFLIEDIHQVKK